MKRFIKRVVQSLEGKSGRREQSQVAEDNKGDKDNRDNVNGCVAVSVNQI